MPVTTNSDEAILELFTIRDLLRWTISQFHAGDIYYGHGTDNAWDEALVLILHALHMPPDINPQVIDARLTVNERRKIIRLVMRRIKERIPSAYITREAWFAGLPFYVDERVLIPRSPLAELIEQEFSPWIEPEKISNILDLGTGSACIAIACAMQFPDATVDAVDISESALEVAKINVTKHHLEERVHLIQSNLFSELKHKKYDVIVSNPPYVSAAEMTSLPEEYQHEPALGLVAGEHGLDFALEILRQASRFLNPHGILIVEVGNSETALIQRFPHIPFTWVEFQRGGGGVFLLTQEQLKQIKL